MTGTAQRRGNEEPKEKFEIRPKESPRRVRLRLHIINRLASTYG